MKIISWNCNGGIRSKFSYVDELDFDVCIIQECEDPSSSPVIEYKNWAGTHLWIGENRNKGIGVFVRNGNSVLLKNLIDGGNKLFLPFTVNNDVTVIAVWTKKSDKTSNSYVGQLWSYLKLNSPNIDPTNCMIIGDFNSNAVWDNKRPNGNHSTVVEFLKALGIQSLYHLHRNEAYGEETEPTHYMYRKKDKGYHIDYCFASNSIIEKPHYMTLGEPSYWLDKSDHMPLIIEVEC